MAALRDSEIVPVIACGTRNEKLVVVVCVCVWVCVEAGGANSAPLVCSFSRAHTYTQSYLDNYRHRRCNYYAQWQRFRCVSLLAIACLLAWPTHPHT